MISKLNILFFLALCLPLASNAQAQSGDFVIITTVETPFGEVEGANYFFGEYVVETAEGEADAIYNLDEMWWRGLAGPDSGLTITLAQAEEWSDASLNMSDSTLLETVDEDVAAFARALVYPNLNMRESGDTLIFENVAFRYEITDLEPLTEEQVGLFYAFDRLNAFWKAMVYRKLPPFAQLEVSEALAARGVISGMMTLTIRSPQGDTSMTVHVHVEEVEPDEAEEFRSLLLK